MPTFNSTFQIGGTTVPFRALITGYGEDVGAGITINLPVLVQDLTTWGALASLRTLAYRATVIPMGTSVVIDTVAGAGAGTLNVPGLGSWNPALLTGLHRTGVTIEGFVQGSVTFFVGS